METIEKEKSGVREQFDANLPFFLERSKSIVSPVTNNAITELTVMQCAGLIDKLNNDILNKLSDKQKEYVGCTDESKQIHTINSIFQRLTLNNPEEKTILDVLKTEELLHESMTETAKLSNAVSQKSAQEFR